MFESKTKAYLALYNAAMLAEWGLVGATIARHFATGGAVSTLFPAVRVRVRRLLFLSCLEIVHAALKLVRSPVATTATQCLVRLASFVGAMDLGSAAVAQSGFCAATMVAWTLSELIRYGFYLSGLVARTPGWLTWLRYSAFIVLYPIGIAGEMGSFYKAVPYVRETGVGSIRMPNAVNFAFDYGNAILALLVCAYPPGGWSMFQYMLAQRRKVLGARPPASS